MSRKIVGSRSIHESDNCIIKDIFTTENEVPDFSFEYATGSNAKITTRYEKKFQKDSTINIYSLDNNSYPNDIMKEFSFGGDQKAKYYEEPEWVPHNIGMNSFPCSSKLGYSEDQRTRVADLYNYSKRSYLTISKKDMGFNNYEQVIYKYNLPVGSKEYIYNSVSGELMEAIFCTETKKLHVNFCNKTAKLYSLTNNKCSSLASYSFIESDADTPMNIMHPYLINDRKSLDDFLYYNYDTNGVISYILSGKYEKDIIDHSDGKVSKTMRYPIDMMISPFCVVDCDYADESIVYDEDGMIIACSIDYIANCD